jgi:hypothetical protein
MSPEHVGSDFRLLSEFELRHTVYWGILFEMEMREEYGIRSEGTNEIYRSQTTAAKCRELAADAVAAKLQLKSENFVDAIEKFFQVELPTTDPMNQVPPQSGDNQTAAAPPN